METPCPISKTLFQTDFKGLIFRMMTKGRCRVLQSFSLCNCSRYQWCLSSIGSVCVLFVLVLLYMAASIQANTHSMGLSKTDDPCYPSMICECFKEHLVCLSGNEEIWPFAQTRSAAWICLRPVSHALHNLKAVVDPKNEISFLSSSKRTMKVCSYFTKYDVGRFAAWTYKYWRLDRHNI